MYASAASVFPPMVLRQNGRMDELSKDIPDAWLEHARAYLQRLKTSRGMTYQEIADLCVLPRSTVSGIILGEDKLTTRALVHFAAGFGISTDEILGSGTAVASSLPRLPATAGGVLDIRDFESRRFFVSITVDLPELDLRAGDLVEVDRDAKIDMRALVVVREGGVSRLYRVRSLNPTVLARDAGPAVVFDERWHEMQGRVVRMERRDP